MDNKNIGYIILEGANSDPSSVSIEKTGWGKQNKILANATFMSAEMINRNGRRYEYEDTAREIKCPRTLELLSKQALRSEQGHPFSTDLSRQSVIWEPNCSCIILSLEMVGNDVKGQFTTTSNALGKALDEEMRDGYLPAFSLRALGSIQQTRQGALVKNLRLITFDQVIYPSFPNAYTDNIVKENNNIMMSEDDKKKIQINNEGLIIPVTNDKIIRYLQSESANLKFIKECFDFAYNNIMVDKSGTRVQLTTNSGDIMVVNLESYIHNELMNYAEEYNNLYNI